MVQKQWVIIQDDCEYEEDGNKSCQLPVFIVSHILFASNVSAELVHQRNDDI